MKIISTNLWPREQPRLSHPLAQADSGRLDQDGICRRIDEPHVPPFGEEGVGRAPASPIVVVVVEDDGPARQQGRVTGFQAETDGVVPVAIDVGKGDPASGIDAHGLFELALLEMDAVAVGIETKPPKAAQHTFEQIIFIAIIALAGDAFGLTGSDDRVALMRFGVVALRGGRNSLEYIKAEEAPAWPHGIGNDDR